jgi:type II secretion system protein H
MSRRAKQRGFTLLELMIVLTLIAILSAMIIPEMRGTYEDALLRSATSETACAMDLAASRAASTGRPHRARFERKSGQWIIERSARTGSDDFEPVDNLTADAGRIDERISVRIVRPDEELSESGDAREERETREPQAEPEAARFFPDGAADARVIILTDRMGVRSTLKINPATGRVRIVKEPKPE